MAAAIEPRYEIAGQGTYGMVVQPALPNRNIAFPQNVTKIYKKKKYYNKAIANSKNLQNKLQLPNTQVHPYHTSYTLKNVPRNVRQTVKHFVGAKEDNSLWMLRAPNLGKSIAEIESFFPWTNKLRTIPYQTICQEMYKCMEVVKSIKDAGYIHGDIRETNVLCNLDTGKLTIIDFDWLLPFDSFEKQYPTFFYSHPPECLFIWGRDNITTLNISGNYESNLNIYDTIHKEYDIYDSERVADAMTSFFTALDIKRSHLQHTLFEIAKHYIDSYGLALSFTKLLSKAWHVRYQDQKVLHAPFGVWKIDSIKTEEEYNKFISIRQFIFENLLPSMLDSDYRERWTIEKALMEFQKAMEGIGMYVFSKENAWIEFANSNRNKESTSPVLPNSSGSVEASNSNEMEMPNSVGGQKRSKRSKRNKRNQTRKQNKSE
jgi:serine/threonine protein kinase